MSRVKLDHFVTYFPWANGLVQISMPCYLHLQRNFACIIMQAQSQYITIQWDNQQIQYRKTSLTQTSTLGVNQRTSNNQEF